MTSMFLPKIYNQLIDISYLRMETYRWIFFTIFDKS